MRDFEKIKLSKTGSQDTTSEIHESHNVTIIKILRTETFYSSLRLLESEKLIDCRVRIKKIL